MFRIVTKDFGIDAVGDHDRMSLAKSDAAVKRARFVRVVDHAVDEASEKCIEAKESTEFPSAICFAHIGAEDGEVDASERPAREEQRKERRQIRFVHPRINRFRL